ncbi:tRNA isopentenyl-2-thiomethyl-A-37 hydroxylase MiaE [Microcoleus sp. herbarium12]
MIEPRSHERLGLLGENCPDRELAKLYRSLMAKASPAITEFMEF